MIHVDIQSLAVILNLKLEPVIFGCSAKTSQTMCFPFPGLILFPISPGQNKQGKLHVVPLSLDTFNKTVTGHI